MEERRELFDASPYLLFEASGDSESARDLDAAFTEDSDAAAAAEDDAQSWCDFSDRLHEVVDGGDDIRVGEIDYFSADEDDCDEEDGVVDQCRRRAAAEMTKSKAFEESNAVMSEREGDRLFWEACLAS